jgi:hypothetical protein
MAELLPMPTTSKYIYILKKTTIFFKKNTPKPPKTVQKRLFHSENTLKTPKISPISGGAQAKHAVSPGIIYLRKNSS